jgi:hypothetical protein
MAVVITNFRVKKLRSGDIERAKVQWASSEFISSDDLWIASFDMDGETHHAGLRLGRRPDVAEDIEQLDILLRVREEAFDADKFIPEWDVGGITQAVYDEFMKLLSPEDPKPSLADRP